MQHPPPSLKPYIPQLSGGAALALPLQPSRQEVSISLHLENLKRMVHRLQPMRRQHNTGPPIFPQRHLIPDEA